jgi:hypothetical protein
MLLLCTGGSPLSYFLPSAYKGLFLVCLKVLRLLLICSLLKFSGEHSLHLSDVELQFMDIDSCKDMFGLPKRVIIIIFSFHLGEPLVLDLAMLSFISLPYTVLYHNLQFLYLIAFSEFMSGW